MSPAQRKQSVCLVSALGNNSVKGITWISMIKINMLEVYTTEFDILNSINEQFSGLALVRQRYNLLKLHIHDYDMTW